LKSFGAPLTIVFLKFDRVKYINKGLIMAPKNCTLLKSDEDFEKFKGALRVIKHHLELQGFEIIFDLGRHGCCASVE
jgi:hypothetical protein